MKQFFGKHMLGILGGMLALMLIVIAAICLAGCGKQANADMTTANANNPSVASPGYETLTLPIMGTWTGASTKTGVASVRLPYPYMLNQASVYCQSATGTKVQAKLVFSNGTVTFANLSTPYQHAEISPGMKLLDASSARVDIVQTGVGGSAKNLTITLGVRRR